MSSQDNNPIFEIGDASRPFPWSFDKPLNKEIQNLIDSARDLKAMENWREMPDISATIKGDKAKYRVLIRLWLKRYFTLSFGGKKPGSTQPLFEMAARLDFNVENQTDETETNLNEQYKLMASITEIGITFLNDCHKNLISLEEFSIYAKPDDNSEVSKTDSRRGRMYFEYVKKNLNKLNFKVTARADNERIKISGGHWTSGTGSPIPGAYYNESMTFKKFEVFEEEEMNTFMKMRSKDQKPDIDKKKEEEIEKYREERMKVCPRCGQKEGDCECPEKDFYSTVNAYRIPKGQMVNIKEYEDFLNEDAEVSAFTHTYDLGMSWWKRWEMKNRSKYDFHHVKQDLYWSVYSKDGIHLFTFDYDQGKVHTDEPINFFQT
jgi:hypothetical protein